MRYILALLCLSLVPLLSSKARAQAFSSSIVTVVHVVDTSLATTTKDSTNIGVSGIKKNVMIYNAGSVQLYFALGSDTTKGWVPIPPGVAYVVPGGTTQSTVRTKCQSSTCRRYIIAGE